MKKLVFRAYIFSRRTKRNPLKPIKKIAKDVAVASALEVIVHHKLPQASVVIDVVATHGLYTCIRLLEF
jgi:hypothetical protein